MNAEQLEKEGQTDHQGYLEYRGKTERQAYRDHLDKMGNQVSLVLQDYR